MNSSDTVTPEADLDGIYRDLCGDKFVRIEQNNGRYELVDIFTDETLRFESCVEKLDEYWEKYLYQVSETVVSDPITFLHEFVDDALHTPSNLGWREEEDILYAFGALGAAYAKQ
jgi:hypothetical protein